MKQSKVPYDVRLQIYQLAYEKYKLHKLSMINQMFNHAVLGLSDACGGMCIVLKSAISDWCMDRGEISYAMHKTNFPEFFSYKPKTGWKYNPMFWWTVSINKGGYAKRLAMLERLSKGLSKGQ